MSVTAYWTPAFAGVTAVRSDKLDQTALNRSMPSSPSVWVRRPEASI